MINDPEMVESFKMYCHDILGNKVQEAEKMNGSSGSEDFSFISQKVPSIMVSMAAGQPEKGHCYPQHHPKVTFDESVLPYGTTLFTYASTQWLKGE